MSETPTLLFNKTVPPKKALLNFAPICQQCENWCCHDETPYASPEELRDLEVKRIEQKADKSCQFLVNHRCSVWSKKPMECTFFPFDLIDIGDTVWWCLWEVCPASPLVDNEQSLQHLEAMIQKRWSPAYIRDYLTYHQQNDSPKYEKLTYRLLRPLTPQK